MVSAKIQHCGLNYLKMAAYFFFRFFFFLVLIFLKLDESSDR